MSRKLVKWESGKIVVRSATVQDDINAQLIEASLLTGFPPDKSGLYRQFAILCVQTEESEGLPFKPEFMLGANPEAQKLAYEAFTRLPQNIRDKWRTASITANGNNTIEISDLADEDDEKK